MKKTIKVLFLLISVGVLAQVNVTTVGTSFNGSGGLSLDDIGNLYIADFGDFLFDDGHTNNVLKMDANFNITIFSSGFMGASGNDFDSNGVLFQSDIFDNAIYKIVGGVRTFVTSDGIQGPIGIIFDSSDNFFVCNCTDSTIRKVTPGGVSTQFASGSEFSCPNGITIDENDNLYVTNFSNTNIVKITPAGVTSVIGNTPVGNGHLDYDENSRNLYIASYAGNQIFYLNIDNPIMQLLAGTGVRGNDDGDGSNATFSTPNGVAVTQTGDSLFVNCAVPLNGQMINPQVIRLITGITLSIEDNTTPVYNVAIYPNPVTNEFTIESDLTMGYSSLNLKVYTIDGKVVKEINNISNQGLHLKVKVDISALSSGNYLFALFNGSKQLANGKITKE